MTTRVRLSAILAATALGLSFASAETLTILHTNDVHSRIEPITKYDNTCNAEDNDAGECFGGAARLKTAIDTERAREGAGPILLLDGGDQFQGSLFYIRYKGQAAAELMNLMGYDAMTVGNHEFDDGTQTLADFGKALDFPLLFANADLADDSPIKGVTPPTSVLEVDGQRYGLIGLVPTDTADLAKPGEGVAFTDPVAATRDAVAELTQKGVDRIILLSHSGLSVDKEVGAQVDGVDVIVGGHSHTLLANTLEGAAGPYPTVVTSPDGSNVYIVQAGAYGKYLGRLEVTFDEDGNVTEATGEPILLDASVAEDEAVKARVTELAIPLEEIRQQVVGATTAQVDGSRENCRARECAMGNLVADAMLERVAGQGVSIAIQNGGGLRASIDEGDVTMGEILTVLPFQNTLATFQLTGADVVASLENGVSQIEDGKGRFPQVAGLRYTLSMDAPPNGGRISDVMVKEGDDWVPIDEAKLYSLVTNDFMRRGGDGYNLFAENAQNAYDFGPSLEEVLASYLADVGPYTPALDGRITVK
ncbi:MAG: bifunctional metallophosphatase/5'-nucleotidase [Pseudomonadota bacterium]